MQLVFLDAGLPGARAVLGCRGSSVVRQGGWGHVMTKWGVRIHGDGGHRHTKRGDQGGVGPTGSVFWQKNRPSPVAHTDLMEAGLWSPEPLCFCSALRSACRPLGSPPRASGAYRPHPSGAAEGPCFPTTSRECEQLSSDSQSLYPFSRSRRCLWGRLMPGWWSQALPGLVSPPVP